MRTASPAATGLKLYGGLYLLGGCAGVVELLPQLQHLSVGFIGAITWLVLIAQLAAALYGGYLAVKGRALGAQLLYWLSVSCVPVLSCGLVSYWSSFGLGAFPTFNLSSWNFGAHFQFEFGYEARFWLLPELQGLTIGCNLIAIWLAVALKRHLRNTGDATWPIVLAVKP